MEFVRVAFDRDLGGQHLQTILLFALHGWASERQRDQI